MFYMFRLWSTTDTNLICGLRFLGAVYPAFEKSIVFLGLCHTLKKKSSLRFLALGLRNHWHQPYSFGKLSFSLAMFLSQHKWNCSKVSSRQCCEINKMWVFLPSLLHDLSCSCVLPFLPSLRQDTVTMAPLDFSICTSGLCKKDFLYF